MKKVLDTSLRYTTACLLACCAFGCSSTSPTPKKERKNFSLAVRQFAPEPVYNRLQTTYLPHPLPNLNPGTSNKASASIVPIFQFEMQEAALEQIAKTMANMARYTSYCSSLIAERKINISGLGTIDEIAKLISEKAGINVVIDHKNKEVRFLADAASPAEDQGKGVSLQEDAEPDFDNVVVSQKTNGYLNKIKIEG